MSGLTLTLRMEGLDRVHRGLGMLEKAGADPKPFLEDAGEYLLRSTLYRWRAEVDPQGQPWKALSPAYALGKGSKKGGVNKILQLRGRLIKSVHWGIRGKTLFLGTNVVYSRIHQEGGKTGRGGHALIPARPFLGISAENRRRLVHLVNEHLKAALNG